MLPSDSAWELRRLELDTMPTYAENGHATLHENGTANTTNVSQSCWYKTLLSIPAILSAWEKSYQSIKHERKPCDFFFRVSIRLSSSNEKRERADKTWFSSRPVPLSVLQRVGENWTRDYSCIQAGAKYTTLFPEYNEVEKELWFTIFAKYSRKIRKIFTRFKIFRLTD